MANSSDQSGPVPVLFALDVTVVETFMTVIAVVGQPAIVDGTPLLFPADL